MLASKLVFGVHVENHMASITLSMMICVTGLVLSEVGSAEDQCLTPSMKFKVRQHTFKNKQICQRISNFLSYHTRHCSWYTYACIAI